MQEKQPSPLQASFWLSNQEKSYILVICAIALIGMICRYFYLKNERPEAYTPAGIETVQQEGAHE